MHPPPTGTEGAVMKAEQQRLPRFAVLIDADNTSPQIAGGLFEEVAKFGEASVRRIYGDFSGSQLKSWTDRRFLSRVFRQRFHAPCLTPARTGRRRLRFRRAENAGEFPAGMPPVHLYRELVAGSCSCWRGYDVEIKIVA